MRGHFFHLVRILFVFGVNAGAVAVAVLCLHVKNKHHDKQFGVVPDCFLHGVKYVQMTPQQIGVWVQKNQIKIFRVAQNVVTVLVVKPPRAAAALQFQMLVQQQQAGCGKVAAA